MAMSMKPVVLVVAMSVALAGCKQQAASDAEGGAASAASAPAEPATEAAPAETVEAPAEAAPAPFDIARIPLTDKPLGDWPYLAVPAGYEWEDEKTLDLSRVPFWTGQALAFVEGKVFLGRIDEAGDKQFSRFEVLKRVEDALTALGATKVTTSGIPEAILEKDMPKDFGSEFYAGAGGYRSAGEELSTYVIRHADRNVWFKVAANTDDASILVAETEPAAAE